MSAYWANLVKTGNPNGSGLPEWPLYTTSEKKIMLLAVKQEAKPIADSGGLDFLYNKMSTGQ